jgi:transposase
MPPSAHLIADKGYDSTAFRNWLRKRGTTPVIPPHKSRKVQYRYDKALYRQRNVIERMFGRLKDFRPGSQPASTTQIVISPLITVWLQVRAHQQSRAYWLSFSHHWLTAPETLGFVAHCPASMAIKLSLHHELLVAQPAPGRAKNVIR